ncbi:M15 family metallopeptidase [Pseudodesulfovibrio sp. zrk46]|uniref:M15 family metallopeptidase n=1 Tax=Pseudodesulfovibrio sp. zrk46 TaxID=2725288 RepID=UPI001449FE67|nr:M15 family metallopeptidase [Pseudodesulfovibrio sp. zrk46]QJB55405.1 M15 family metallopeptidase [Pseudodesulfovibrio sp. zrk46]
MLRLSHLSLTVALCFILCASAFADGRPKGFTTLNELIPDATYDVRYYTDENFVGAPITGYEKPLVILTDQAAKALVKVQAELAPFGLGLKFFDGYRPQRAVDHFVRWAKDLDDQKTKPQYYPDVEKDHLFRDGYIAAKSGHSRGSTVDLTIMDLATGQELNMGTPFDYFGLESWPDHPDFSPEIRSNRALLRAVMIRHGFKPLKEEWWHFTLSKEPFPQTYFNFPVE